MIQSTLSFPPYLPFSFEESWAPLLPPKDPRLLWNTRCTTSGTGKSAKDFTYKEKWKVRKLLLFFFTWESSETLLLARSSLLSATKSGSCSTVLTASSIVKWRGREAYIPWLRLWVDLLLVLKWLGWCQIIKVFLFTHCCSLIFFLLSAGAYCFLSTVLLLNRFSIVSGTGKSEIVVIWDSSATDFDLTTSARAACTSGSSTTLFVISLVSVREAGNVS